MKRHVVTDAAGTPLLVETTPANVRDEKPVLRLVEGLPAVKGPRGRPRRKPKELLGDRGYGFAWVIAAIVLLGIKSLLAPRGSPHGSGLGRRRYVVERAMAWLANFRRLRLCYERTGYRHQALNELACCVVCAGKLRPNPREKRKSKKRPKRAA